MKITMVKKIMEDGKECRKCQEVTQRLKENNEWPHIGQIVWADVNKPESAGHKIAKRYGIDIAPFFLVEDGKQIRVYKTYLELRRDVFNKEPEAADIEIEEKRKPRVDADEDLYWL